MLKCKGKYFDAMDSRLTPLARIRTHSASFCEKNYGVTFPLMKKSDVNGDNANE